MGICGPCKENDHYRHRGTYEVEVRRKGISMKKRKAVCECRFCVFYAEVPT